MHITIVRTPPDAPLQQRWSELLSTVNRDVPGASQHWLKPVLARAAADRSLRLVLIEQGSTLCGLMPLCVLRQGRGPLRRCTLRSLLPAPVAGSSMLVAGGAEQTAVLGLVAALDGPLRGWDRVELAGLLTDTVLPALLLANARSLGVCDLGMTGVERRRTLSDQHPPPKCPENWRHATLTPALDDASGRAVEALLHAAGVEGAAALVHATRAAQADGAALWILRDEGRLAAAAVTLTAASGAHYVVAAAARVGAPVGAERALHTLLMARARAAGAERYACWCKAPAGIFDDECPVRSFCIERYNAVNTRNRLWNRLIAGRRGNR